MTPQGLGAGTGPGAEAVTPLELGAGVAPRGAAAGCGAVHATPPAAAHPAAIV